MSHPWLLSGPTPQDLLPMCCTGGGDLSLRMINSASRTASMIFNGCAYTRSTMVTASTRPCHTGSAPMPYVPSPTRHPAHHKVGACSSRGIPSPCLAKASTSLHTGATPCPIYTGRGMGADNPSIQQGHTGPPRLNREDQPHTTHKGRPSQNSPVQGPDTPLHGDQRQGDTQQVT